MADVATDINLARRLGERKVGRPHPDRGVGTEHLAGEKQDGLLKVGEGDILVDVQTFDLMEYAVRAGRDGLIAEHPARADDPDGELHRLHGADLDRRRVGPKKQRIGMPCRNEEGVLHVPGRMVRREIQGFEHMVIILNLRTFRHIVTEFPEYVHNLLADNRDGMPRTKGERCTGHAQVLLRTFGHRGSLGHVLQLINLGSGSLLELVELLSELSFEFRTARAELLEQLSDLTLLSKKPDSGFLNFFRIGGFQRGHLGEQLFNRFFHYIPEILLFFRISFVTGFFLAGGTTLEILGPLFIV